MRKTNKIILITLVVFILLLGIGYAAIQNITLNISGTAAADPNQANFKVRFVGTPTVSDDVLATATITDSVNAKINVSGLIEKGQRVTATYTIKNDSESISADLAVSTTNSNVEYFGVKSELDKVSLIAGEETTVTVMVELTKTPINESVISNIGVKIEAIPVQPGQEGSSGKTNDYSEIPVPLVKNEYGFYYGEAYSRTLENGDVEAIVFNEDGSIEKYTNGKIADITDVGIAIYNTDGIDISAYTGDSNSIMTISEDGKTMDFAGDSINLDSTFFYINGFESGTYYRKLFSSGTKWIKTFPVESSHNDVYIKGDYFYLFQGTAWLCSNTANVAQGYLPEGIVVADKTKTRYDDILSNINGVDVKSLSSTFSGCTNLVESPRIPDTIVTLAATFSGCTSLVVAPEIPNSVTSMNKTFYGCTSLDSVPVIPEGVTIMTSAFEGCTSLTSGPTIPSTVTNMSKTFSGCTSLVTASEIPESVTNMSNTFLGCISLEVPPVIPGSVTNLTSTFEGCTSLRDAPVIPASVTNMNRTFADCISLEGTVEIDANPTKYTECFANVELMNIEFIGASNLLNEIRQTGITSYMFYIYYVQMGNRSYGFEKGMTWREWVRTEYNTADLVILNNSIGISNGSELSSYIVLDDVEVHPDDLIVNVANYRMASK